jgi:hypothetical protein
MFFLLYSSSLEHNFHSLEHSNQQSIELDGKEVVETEQCYSWETLLYQKTLLYVKLEQTVSRYV